MQKTYYPKADDVNRGWVLVDANDQNLGRLATQIATTLLGKNRPTYTPGVDTGDFVVVVNAERVRVTGNKLEEKMYYHHTGFPGGIRATSLKDMLARHPDRVLRRAVWGMLPHSPLGRQIIKKLKIYVGPEHPHQAQDPKPMDLA